jgi:hypothetical protein
MEVISDLFLQYLSFVIVCSDKIFSYSLDVVDGVYIVHLITLLVMFDAALCLADSACTGTSNTAAYLNSSKSMEFTKDTLLGLHI